MSKILIIKPGSDHPDGWAKEEQERIAKCLKDNGFILLNSCYFSYEVVDVESIRLED